MEGGGKTPTIPDHVYIVEIAEHFVVRFPRCRPIREKFQKCVTMTDYMHKMTQIPLKEKDIFCSSEIGFRACYGTLQAERPPRRARTTCKNSRAIFFTQSVNGQLNGGDKTPYSPFLFNKNRICVFTLQCAPKVFRYQIWFPSL